MELVEFTIMKHKTSLYRTNMSELYVISYIGPDKNLVYYWYPGTYIICLYFARYVFSRLSFPSACKKNRQLYLLFGSFVYAKYIILALDASYV